MFADDGHDDCEDDDDDDDDGDDDDDDDDDIIDDGNDDEDHDVDIAVALAVVFAGGPPFSSSGYDLTPLTDDEVASMVDKLTELQKTVLVQASFFSATAGDNCHSPGTW